MRRGLPLLREASRREDRDNDDAWAGQDAGRWSPEWKEAVLHAHIRSAGTELMAAEIPNAEPVRSAYLSLGMDGDSEAERVFAAFSGGGQVLMAIQETFFASRFWPGAGPVRHQLDDRPQTADAGEPS